MKSILLLFASMAMVCPCFAQSQVKINFDYLTNDTVIVRLRSEQTTSIERSDTLIARKKSVTYAPAVNTARLAIVTYKNGGSRPRQLQICVVPGENGVLTVRKNEEIWSGSTFYNDLALLNTQIAPFETEIQQSTEDYSRKVRAGANQDSLRQVIMPRYEELTKKINDIKMNYIKANPNSNLCAFLMLNMRDRDAALKTVSEKVKKGVFAPIIDNINRQVNGERERAEAAKKVAPGMMAPDFTLKDINGHDLSLSDLRGKYVILDFWGSWCGWCIKGFPDMKKYYEKYSDKFEILGIDCNDTEDKWKDAVAKYGLPWKHVYNPRTSTVTKQYAITGYPTKIIVGPDGKIVRTIVGEDPAFYNYLDSLFK